MLSIGANLSNLAYTQCSGSRDLEWRRKGWLCDCVWSSDTHVYHGLKLNATAKYNHGTEFVDEFNTCTRAQPRSGWRVWAWRSTPRTGSCCTTSWRGPAWTTSMPSATCWSPRAVSTCAPRYGRTTENSCYWLLNFPFAGVHPAVAYLLRPGGGGGHRADRQGECGGVSPEHLSKISK